MASHTPLRTRRLVCRGVVSPEGFARRVRVHHMGPGFWRYAVLTDYGCEAGNIDGGLWYWEMVAVMTAVVGGLPWWETKDLDHGRLLYVIGSNPVRNMSCAAGGRLGRLLAWAISEHVLQSMDRRKPIRIFQIPNPRPQSQ
jgi:hypothetical protein